MTQREFAEECATVLVDPGVALENENIRQALKERNDSEVRRLLKEEF